MIKLGFFSHNRKDSFEFASAAWNCSHVSLMNIGHDVAVLGTFLRLLRDRFQTRLIICVWSFRLSTSWE